MCKRKREVCGVVQYRGTYCIAYTEREMSEPMCHITREIEKILFSARRERFLWQNKSKYLFHSIKPDSPFSLARSFSFSQHENCSDFIWIQSAWEKCAQQRKKKTISWTSAAFRLSNIERVCWGLSPWPHSREFARRRARFLLLFRSFVPLNLADWGARSSEQSSSRSQCAIHLWLLGFCENLTLTVRYTLRHQLCTKEFHRI